MRNVLLIAAVLSAVPASSRAQDIPDECRTVEARRAMVDSLFASVDRLILDRIEPVPPTEAGYIDKEYQTLMELYTGGRDSAIDASANARFTLLTSNRFYYAQRARAKFQGFKSAVNAGVDYNGNDLYDFAQGIGSGWSALASADEALTEYLNADSKRASPIQGNIYNASLNFSYAIGMIHNQLSAMLECATRPLVGLGR